MRARSAWMALVLLAGCAAPARNIIGTKLPDSLENRAIVGAVERYRIAVEKGDVAALARMASPNYWEDGGTPSAADDYGFAGLEKVLEGRFQKASAIRYSLRYQRVRRQEQRAFVEVLVDASYTVDSHRGEERRDKRDQNEFVLEWDETTRQWRFLSGM